MQLKQNLSLAEFKKFAKALIGYFRLLEAHITKRKGSNRYIFVRNVFLGVD